MATSKEYMQFIMEQLPEGAACRAMMGEYVLYYKDKVIGGIYDDRFLIKPVAAAREMMPDAAIELPYEGAKGMLLADNVDNREFLAQLLEAIYPQLPKQRKKK